MAMELEPIEMPVAASSPAPAAATESGPTTSSSSDLFDLETYISRYESSSETRLQRLLLVASVSQSQSSSQSARSDRMAEQAYRMAERQCRDTSNVRTYRQVFGGQVAAAAAAGSGSGGKFGPLECFRFPATHVMFCVWVVSGARDTCRCFVRATHCAVEHVPAVGDIFFIDLIYFDLILLLFRYQSFDTVQKRPGNPLRRP